MATQDKQNDAGQSLNALLSALLLAAEKPMAVRLMVDLINQAVDEEEWPESVTVDSIEDQLYEMQLQYTPDSGIELVNVAGGWRFRTSPHFAHMVRRLWPERKIRLSKAALEALSVIAYRQPCTRLDVESVRGVDCGGVVRSLLERGMVRIVGKKDEPGRPLLYGTTSLFLETFSMDDLSALPTLREIDALDAEEAARLAFETNPDFAHRFPGAEPTDTAEAEDSGPQQDESTGPDAEDMEDSEGSDSAENSVQSIPETMPAEDSEG
jgi:segregation and condensation protein B